MKGSKLSLILLLSAAPVAAAEPRGALYCGTGRLDLSCASFAPSLPAKAPYIGFEPLNPLYADRAYVIRWGEGKRKAAQPRWTVQLGSSLRQALFWAAVASVLL